MGPSGAAGRRAAGRQAVICPEPDCLKEREGRERTTRWEKDHIVETGDHGWVTLIALPCSRHEDSFSFQESWPDGWYERFAGAFYAQQPAQEPMTCERCGRRYTSYLWGRAWDWCPSCTYGEIQEIREDEVRDLRTHTMELGRRLGLGWKGTEYIGLPLDEREKRLESRLAFIQKANRDWHAAGGDPNGTRNLEDEHDRLYAAEELPVLGRRPPGYTGWASSSDNGGSSCHHDAAMLNAPPMMFSASRCSFVSSTSPDCTRANPASSTFNVSIIALYPGVLHHLVEHLQDGYLPVYLGRHPTYPQTPFETPEGAILGRNSKSPRF